MSRYAGWIRWDAPGLAWLTRRRHTATILDGISLAAKQQKPLADAVIQLAAGYPQAKVARRLWAAFDDMEAGGNDLETLHRHGLLGKTDLALLQSAQRNGNLAWAAGTCRQQPPPHGLSCLCDGANGLSAHRCRLRPRGCDDRTCPVHALSHAYFKPDGFAMKRRGFTLVEILVALLLLGTLTTVCLQFFVGVNGQWREQVAPLAAAEEAANVMERLAAVAWDDLSTQSGDKYSLSTQARKQLPEGRVEVKVSGTLRVPPVNGTRSVPDTEGAPHHRNRPLAACAR